MKESDANALETEGAQFHVNLWNLEIAIKQAYQNSRSEVDLVAAKHQEIEALKTQLVENETEGIAGIAEMEGGLKATFIEKTAAIAVSEEE